MVYRVFAVALGNLLVLAIGTKHPTVLVYDSAYYSVNSLVVLRCYAHKKKISLFIS